MATASSVLIKAYMLEMANEDYIGIAHAVIVARSIEKTMSAQAVIVLAQQCVFDLIREGLVVPVVTMLAIGGVQKKCIVDLDRDSIDAMLYEADSWMPEKSGGSREICLDITQDGRKVFASVYESYSAEVYARIYPK
jgi:hypothetical protein